MGEKPLLIYGLGVHLKAIPKGFNYNNHGCNPCYTARSHKPEPRRGSTDHSIMSTYTQIIYQIVFSTKHREPTLVGADMRMLLYKYIWGVLKNNKCILYKVNGVEDHIHILTHLHPTTSLSALVKDIKVSTSIWIKKQGIFPGFKGWAVGYGGFTYTIKERPIVERYIENQLKHHSQTSFLQEYTALLEEHKVSFDRHFLP